MPTPAPKSAAEGDIPLPIIIGTAMVAARIAKSCCSEKRMSRPILGNGALIRGDGTVLCEKKSALSGLGDTLIRETVGLINSLGPSGSPLAVSGAFASCFSFL